MEMTIYTHRNVDLDAAASVWAVRTFVPATREAKLVFVPANWDGDGFVEFLDQALDIRAGGHGFKGDERADGTVGSCFASLIARLAGREDQRALRSLVEYVELQDTGGLVVEQLVPDAGEHTKKVLDDTGLNAIMNALRTQFEDDEDKGDAALVDAMSGIFTGILGRGGAARRAEIEADTAELFGGGTVAIVWNKREHATNGLLFARGVQVVIYVDGMNLGLVRSKSTSLRMDDDALCAVLEAKGEKIGRRAGTWFAHPAGFMLAWGTQKAPAESLSRVDARALAVAVAKRLHETSSPLARFMLRLRSLFGRRG